VALAGNKSFYYDFPLVTDAASAVAYSFVSAFGDWLFGRGSATFLADDCCLSSSAVVFNPTCP
jgi:hypothetical protein